MQEPRYIMLEGRDAHVLNGLVCRLQSLNSQGKLGRHALSSEETDAVNAYVGSYARATSPSGLHLGDKIDRLKVDLAD